MGLLSNKKVSGKRILGLFVLTNLIFALMLLVTIPHVMGFSDGMKLLDLLPFGYDTEYVRLLLETLGQEGRHAYLYRQIPLDLIYPGLFAISYSRMMAYFLHKMGRLNGLLFNLCLLPFLVGIADYLENFGIIAMLLRYPTVSAGLVKITSVFSVVKSMTSTVFFVALIIVMTIFAIRLIRSKQ